MTFSKEARVKYLVLASYAILLGKMCKKDVDEWKIRVKDAWDVILEHEEVN